MFVILSCLFLAALSQYSSAGKGADFLALWYVMFSCVLSLSYVVVVDDCIDSGSLSFTLLSLELI